MAAPYFTMFWDQDIPPAACHRRERDARVEVTRIAGALDGLQPLAPPPHSWAAREEADVAIWSIAHGAGRGLDGAAGRSTPARFATLHLFAGSGTAGRRPPGARPGRDSGAARTSR